MSKNDVVVPAREKAEILDRVPLLGRSVLVYAGEIHEALGRGLPASHFGEAGGELLSALLHSHPDPPLDFALDPARGDVIVFDSPLVTGSRGVTPAARSPELTRGMARPAAQGIIALTGRSAPPPPPWREPWAP